MILAEFLPPRRCRLWKLAAQMGVRHAIVKCAPELSGKLPPWDFGALESIRRDLARAGLVLHGLEGDQFDMTRIKFGLPGREEDFARYRQMLANMGRLGIPLLCYNFMAGLGWTRAAGGAVLRGGAVGTRFELPPDEPGPLRISHPRLWENYARFLDEVLPAAEAAGVRMGLHPDDPPLPSLGGCARIFGSVAAFDRALGLSPSPSHGITFCQANFKLMGSDLEADFRRWAPRIPFLHVRDVVGSPSSFHEVFHDEAELPMPRMFRVYHEAGFRGAVRCDHVPTMAGESPAVPGYGTLGRLFATGYFKGILQALDIPYI